MPRLSLFLTLAIAGAAVPAAPIRAQDSIAPPSPQALPGHALDAYRTSAPPAQVTDY